MPGSEGKLSPRWSPDGRHVAALPGDWKKLLVLDLEIGQWSEPVTGDLGFPTWFRDGAHLYFQSRDDVIHRLRLRDGRIEKVVSRQGAPRSYSLCGAWFGLDPEGRLLLMRDETVVEVLAFDYAFRRGPAKEAPMVETASTMMLPLGAKAPSFELPDPAGRTFSLAGFEGSPALLVAFICSHCPYVKHVRAGFAALAAEYQKRGVAVLAIASNDPRAYPDDGPEGMAREAKAAGYSFPYVFDETQEVAKAYGAACTPDFFLFDRDRRLFYRGQMDGSRPGNGVPVTGADLRVALDAVLEGRPSPEVQRPSLGCNIKWKPGNEPPYFPR